MKVGLDADSETIKKSVVKSLKERGRKYIDAGYGQRFIWWLILKGEQPYGSWGNGSAMRVSSAGWLYDTLERAREVARLTAEVTHNHPEGIKGAEATALAIFMARTGKSKDEIKQYIIDEFGYNLSRTLDDIRLLLQESQRLFSVFRKNIIKETLSRIEPDMREVHERFGEVTGLVSINSTNKNERSRQP